MRIAKIILYPDNLKHNFHTVRDMAGKGVKMCAAVKADAYGHGAIEVSKLLEEEGCDYLAVATVAEARDLRKAGIKLPIVLLSLSLPKDYKAVCEMGLTTAVANEEHIKGYAGAAGKNKVPVNLMVDTGMGRIGCRPERAAELAKMIAGNPSLELAGVCTHFPSSDDESEKAMSATSSQFNLFSKAVEEIKAANIDPGLIHAANSGAIIGHKESLFSMARPGISLYGYYPSGDQKRNYELKPVMEFVSKIMFIKKVNAGQSVSYGMTWTAREPTYIATVAAGYADGISRALSNKGRVLIGEKTYPIVGRVTMDQLMLDIGDGEGVNLYDDVVFFGPDKKGPDAEEIANIIGTIPYEVVCGVSSRLKKIYCTSRQFTKSTTVVFPGA